MKDKKDKIRMAKMIGKKFLVMEIGRMLLLLKIGKKLLAVEVLLGVTEVESLDTF